MITVFRKWNRLVIEYCDHSVTLRWTPTDLQMEMCYRFGDDGTGLYPVLVRLLEAVMQFYDYPVQMDGNVGCACRTCGQHPAVYLDQCTACRAKSTVDDDRRFVLANMDRKDVV